MSNYLKVKSVMRWYNLKQNKCPQCGHDMVNAVKMISSQGEKILVHPCGFKIRERRFSQIVTGMITKQIEQELEREQLENY